MTGENKDKESLKTLEQKIEHLAERVDELIDVINPLNGKGLILDLKELEQKTKNNEIEIIKCKESTKSIYERINKIELRRADDFKKISEEIYRKIKDSTDTSFKTIRIMLALMGFIIIFLEAIRFIIIK